MRAESGIRLETLSEKVNYRSFKITIFVAGQTWPSLELAFSLNPKFSIWAASIDVSLMAPVTGDIGCSKHCWSDAVEMIF